MDRIDKVSPAVAGVSSEMPHFELTTDSLTPATPEELALVAAVTAADAMARETAARLAKRKALPEASSGDRHGNGLPQARGCLPASLSRQRGQGAPMLTRNAATAGHRPERTSDVMVTISVTVCWSSPLPAKGRLERTTSVARFKRGG